MVVGELRLSHSFGLVLHSSEVPPDAQSVGWDPHHGIPDRACKVGGETLETCDCVTHHRKSLYENLPVSSPLRKKQRRTLKINHYRSLLDTREAGHLVARLLRGWPGTLRRNPQNEKSRQLLLKRIRRRSGCHGFSVCWMSSFSCPISAAESSSPSDTSRRRDELGTI